MKQPEFYDIYDYIYIPFWKTNLFLYSVIITTAAIVAFFVVRYVLKKRNKKSVITSWQWALNELQKLNPESLATKQEFKAFYFDITKLIKRYLEKRFQFDLIEKTDEEFIAYLKSVNFNPKLVAHIKEILDGSLLIKFANSQALKEQAKKDFMQTKSIIDDTRVD